MRASRSAVALSSVAMLCSHNRWKKPNTRCSQVWCWYSHVGCGARCTMLTKHHALLASHYIFNNAPAVHLFETAPLLSSQVIPLTWYATVPHAHKACKCCKGHTVVMCSLLAPLHHQITPIAAASPRVPSRSHSRSSSTSNGIRSPQMSPEMTPRKSRRSSVNVSTPTAHAPRTISRAPTAAASCCTLQAEWFAVSHTSSCGVPSSSD
jgi:hypothetical protein